MTHGDYYQENDKTDTVAEHSVSRNKHQQSTYSRL